MTIRLRHSALVAVVAILAVAAGLPWEAAAGSPVSDEAFEYAQTFRRSMGLPASDQVVLDSYGRSDYLSDRYGLPLSRQEIDELDARSEMRQRMQPAIVEARSWKDFAGVYIDQRRSGMAVFGFVDNVSTHEDQLRQLLPNGAKFEVLHQRLTDDELLDVKAQVSRNVKELSAQGIDVVSIAPDDVRNVVLVGVSSDRARAEDVLRERFGESVAVERAAAGVLDCSRAGCRPMKGGLEIQGDQGATDLCTSAFIAKTSGGSKRVVTAGHCLVGRKGHPWKHGDPNRTHFGDAVDHTLDSDEDTCGGDYCADAGWLNLDDDELPLADPHEFVRTDAGLIYSFDLVRADSVQLVGDLVFRAGRTTGLRSGLITARNARRKTIGGGVVYWIDGVFVMDRDARGGDSGGPYWVEYDFAGDRFYAVAGIHSHSTPDTNDPQTPCEEDDNDPDIIDCRAWYTTAQTFEAETPLTICTLQSCP